MPAYLIGQVVVHEMARFAPYVAETTAAIERYGGEVIDVPQAVEALEGDWPVGALTALVRIPTESMLWAYWQSPENQKSKELRQATSKSDVALCLTMKQPKAGCPKARL